ncbi:MAG: alpha/beta hydrolase [Solirubrobacteraceae bacterium]
MRWNLRRRTETRHGEIAWDVFGSGPAVVLTHGTPSRSLVWRKVVPRLAERHTVYVWDLLGFGASEHYVEQDVSLVTHGHVLAALVEQWKLERPALIGHDIGAAVVLRAHMLEEVPASHLGLIDGVVLAPWITPRTRQMQRQAQSWASLPDPDLEAQIVEHLQSATVKPLETEVFHGLFGQWDGPEGQALYLRNLAQFDEEHTRAFEPRLATISVPTALIWGEHDAWLPVGTADKIAAQIPGATVTVLPRAGHFSMEDDPPGVTQALVNLLERR